MTIQSIYSMLAYQATNRVALQQADNSATKFLPAEPAKNAVSANTSDRVTLSDAAKALAETEKNKMQPRTHVQEKLLSSASSDRQSAEKMAEDMAYVSSTILYDISDAFRNGGPVTKLASGRNIDDEFISQVNSEASAIDAQRRAIYESEKAKGTDPLQILTMMIDFTNSHASSAYLEATG